LSVCAARMVFDAFSFRGADLDEFIERITVGNVKDLKVRGVCSVTVIATTTTSTTTAARRFLQRD
jgi:hypothetical protein